MPAALGGPPASTDGSRTPDTDTRPAGTATVVESL